MEFFKEETLMFQDNDFEIPNPIMKNDHDQDSDDKRVFLLFYRKSTLLKELLERFDKTIKEHHLKNIFFFKVKEIGMDFNDAFSSVTLFNVSFTKALKIFSFR